MNTGVPGVADADDDAVLDADVGFHDAELRIEDERVGDDEVERLGVGGGAGLAHAVADDFASAEFDLVAVAAALGDQVTLDLHEELRIRKTDTVADGGTEHFRVLAAGEFQGHGKGFVTQRSRRLH